MTPTQQTRLSFRRRAVLAMALAAIGASGCAAGAFAEPALADFQVIDRDSGQPLRVWRHHGRLFIAGRPGARYGLRVTNRSSGRVMVVMSVDGVNVYTGETAGLGQDGYVFDPYETYDLTGWRKSQDEVAAFTFAPLPQSYAARTGRPGEVGVIGMAVFREKATMPVEAPPPAPARTRSDVDVTARRANPAPVPPPPPSMESPMASPPVAKSIPAPVAAAEPRDEKLGTGHGAREWSPIHFVDFERATAYPQSLSQVEYDTYANLVASGVIRPAGEGERRPRPFPAPPSGEGFVPDPPPAP
jgi:hypothetical protein